MLKPNIIDIDAPERPLGKKAVKKLREEKLIPAVIYGPGAKKNVHVTVPEHELEKILGSNKTYIASFKIEGKKYRALLKKVEFHPITDQALHADFYALDEKTPVTLTVPIRITGSAPGVVEGGRLFQPLRRLQIQCDPDKIPAEFTIDVSELNIGDSLHISDLIVEGVKPLQDPIRTIVTIRPPKGTIEEILAAEAEEEAEEEEAQAEGAEEAAADGEAGEQADQDQSSGDKKD